jgi:hypothetical protein
MNFSIEKLKLPLIKYNSKGKILDYNEALGKLYPYDWSRVKNKKNLAQVFEPVFYSESGENEPSQKDNYQPFYASEQKGQIWASAFRVKIDPAKSFAEDPERFEFSFQNYLYGIVFRVNLVYADKDYYIAHLFPLPSHFDRLPSIYSEELWVMTDPSGRILGCNNNFINYSAPEFQGELLMGKALKDMFVPGAWEEHETNCRRNINIQKSAAEENRLSWEKSSASPQVGGSGWIDCSPSARENQTPNMRNLYALEQEYDFRRNDCRIDFTLNSPEPGFGIFFKNDRTTEYRVANGYTFIWRDKTWILKRRGLNAVIQSAEIKKTDAKFTLQIIGGLVRLYCGNKLLLEYADPLPIMESGHNRLGVFFRDNPFTELIVLRRRSILDSRELRDDVLDMRFKVKSDTACARPLFNRDPWVTCSGTLRASARCR